MSSGLIRFAIAGFLAFRPLWRLTPALPSRRQPRLRPGARRSIARAAAPAPVLRRRLRRHPLRRHRRQTRRSALRDKSSGPAEPAQPGEGSTGETVDLPPRPFAYVEGKADKDEIYSAILNSLSSVKRDMDKANLAPAGRPLAVFVESDDTGFKYHAGYPLAAAPEGKSSLSDTVKIGQTPSGKAMRFEHQGAYGDIDATYDAITAYLDDKGIDAQDTFIEEYANDVKDPDDPTLQVNIYVLLK